MHFIVVWFPKYAHASAIEQRARLPLQCWIKPAQAAAKQLCGPLRLRQKWSSVPQGDSPSHTVACKCVADVTKSGRVPLEAQRTARRAGPPAARGRAGAGLWKWNTAASMAWDQWKIMTFRSLVFTQQHCGISLLCRALQSAVYFLLITLGF